MSSATATKSPPDAKRLPDLDERPTICLLKEYTERFRAILQEAEGDIKGFVPLLRDPEKNDGTMRALRLVDLWKNLRPPAVNLAQYVSATIEHGRVDNLTRLELRLRLAEFENSIHFLDMIFEKHMNMNSRR